MKCRGRQKNSQLKDPNEPVKPPKPYIRYSRSVWEKVSSEHPGMNIGQIGNTVGRMWRNLSEDEKEIFNQEHRGDMIKYENEMRLYYKSSGYTEWLKKVESANSPKVKDRSKKQIVQIDKMIIEKQPLPENSYIEAELDSDEEIDYMDIKVESSNRFYRNHALMLELFSDTRVSTASHRDDGDEQRNLEIESQIEQVQSNMTEMNKRHVGRLLEIIQKNEKFDNLMQLENEKLQNLIENRKLCD